MNLRDIGLDLKEKLERDSQRKMESVKNFNAVLKRELDGRVDDISKSSKMLHSSHAEEKRAVQAELAQIQSCHSPPRRKSFHVPTSTQRLNYHTHNIRDHRDRHAHYNRKQCDLARAIVPRQYRRALPPRDAAFAAFSKTRASPEPPPPPAYRSMYSKRYSVDDNLNDVDDGVLVTTLPTQRKTDDATTPHTQRTADDVTPHTQRTADDVTPHTQSKANDVPMVTTPNSQENGDGDDILNGMSDSKTDVKSDAQSEHNIDDLNLKLSQVKTR